MKALLRYKSRHRIFIPRGFNGNHFPLLNPICSSSHGADGQRTYSINEPRWLYHLRQHLFCRAGKQRCGRRGENPVISDRFAGHKANPDTWDKGPDGFRTCSYCGSLHYDDFIELCHRATTQDGYRIEPSTKRYKIYVTQPGVRNASEGAIKFYTVHAPEVIRDADNALYKEAVRLSVIRHDAMLKALRESYQERKH